MKEKLNEIESRKEDLVKSITALVTEKISELMSTGLYEGQPLVVNLTEWDNEEFPEFTPAYNLPHKLTIQVVNDRKDYADTNPLSKGQAYFSYEDSYFKVNLELIVSPYTQLYDKVSDHRDTLISIENELGLVKEEILKAKLKEEKKQMIEQKLKEIESLQAELDEM